MQDRDEDRADVCVRCGATIEDAAIERAYAYGAAGVLCHACARELGGVYDAERERWSADPDLEGLPSDGESGL
jgi:hypothetical protein